MSAALAEYPSLFARSWRDEARQTTDTSQASSDFPHFIIKTSAQQPFAKILKIFGTALLSYAESPNELPGLTGGPILLIGIGL